MKTPFDFRPSISAVINSQQTAGRNSPVGFMFFWIKSNEFHDAFPVWFGRSANIFFPLFNGGIGDAKVQESRELRHGQGKIDPLLAEVLTQSLGLGRVTPQLPEMQ